MWEELQKITKEIKKKSKECKEKWIEDKCQVVKRSANMDITLNNTQYTKTIRNCE